MRLSIRRIRLLDEGCYFKEHIKEINDRYSGKP